MVLINMYFPYSELPDLFLTFRIMVTTMSARLIQKNSGLFASDLEYLVQERPGESTDETLFFPFFGMYILILKTYFKSYHNHASLFILEKSIYLKYEQKNC